MYKDEEENGFVVVGRPEIDSFLSIPAEAMEVIDLLNSGKTVGEVKQILKQKYNIIVVMLWKNLWMLSSYAQVCYAGAAIGSVILFAIFPEYIPQLITL